MSSIKSGSYQKQKGKDVRIQIVEDEGIVALDIRRHLESFGYLVTGTHASGESAIAEFDREQPDLVMMDISLQGKMDGLEAAQIIRDHYNVPVIILTALADEKTIERAKITEPFGYIIKPFEERELRTNIEMAFFRHNLETKLQESEERYRKFFQDDLSADFVADESGVLLACNRAFIEYFRFGTAKEAIGKNIKDHFASSDDAEEFWIELTRQKRLELRELELLRADNTSIDLLANMVADFNPDGSLKEIKGYLIDISKRKQLEQQLRQSQKMEAVGRLAGGVAHDFNNILTVILGYTTILNERIKEDESQFRAELKGIEEAANRASALTRQLLAFSRRQILKPKMVKVNELVKNLDRMISRLITEKVSIRHHLYADTDTIWVDPGQLEQVIMNLMVNARDALPDGGAIYIKTENCTLKEPLPSAMAKIPPGDYVCLVVQDSGIGIAPEHIKMIFEPFFTTKEEERGTGLGLSTVYGIVKQSSGHIQVDSQHNRGTTFRIYFPLSMNRQSEVAEEDRSSETLQGNETVMVVEDEESLRLLSKRILELYGYKVLLASTPEQALELASNPKIKMDLLITDMVMPNISGEELIVRFHEYRKHIRAICMSGYPQSGSTMSDTIRFNDTEYPFIAKPFSPEQFVRMVRRVLDGCK